jgi:hypothetical protein
MENNWIKKGTGFRPDDCPYQVNIISCTECSMSWMDDEDYLCTCDSDEEDDCDES